MISKPLRILVLCTLQTGADAVAQVLRCTECIVGIIGIKPECVDKDTVSGYLDVKDFSNKYGVRFGYVEDYSLRTDDSRKSLLDFDYDLIWVAGWQRLIPDWLINSAPMGVLGVHGSPDGIAGGRGRSPQNWALMLGCPSFDIALFRIGVGVDDGPIILEKSFSYNFYDDIKTSYYKVSLAVASMVLDVIKDPEKIYLASSQSGTPFYLPQRLPSDGLVDWGQSVDIVARHCRALTDPYPGLRTRIGNVEVVIWDCQPFDDLVFGSPGQITACFETGDFLVSCLNGRVLVRNWSASDLNWIPVQGLVLSSTPFKVQISKIVERHIDKFPGFAINSRVTDLLQD